MAEVTSTAWVCTQWPILGHDEPEFLRYSNRQFGPMGADAGHAKLKKPFAKPIIDNALSEDLPQKITTLGARGMRLLVLGTIRG